MLNESGQCCLNAHRNYFGSSVLKLVDRGNIIECEYYKSFDNTVLKHTWK